MVKKLSVVLLFVFSISIFSQELYTPRNIKKAYDNQTRSKDGKPGKNYWQNSGNYSIDFNVDPTTKIISSKENTVSYTHLDVYKRQLLLLSIGLFLEGFLHYKIFLDWVSRQLTFTLNEDQRWKIATSFGLFSLFLSIVFLGVIFLCKMVLRRNHFIIQMEDWLFANMKVIKKPRSERKILR